MTRIDSWLSLLKMCKIYNSRVYYWRKTEKKSLSFPPAHVLTHIVTHGHTHTYCHSTHTSESSKSESLSYSVSHNSPRQCIIKVLPPQPPHPSSSSSSHFHPASCFLLSAPIYLLSPTLPVTQQLRPANPLWKETTEQKITSPPLSHTPSLPFVFSSGLLLTSFQHQHHHPWAVSHPPPIITLPSPLSMSLSVFIRVHAACSYSFLPFYYCVIV